MITQEKKATLLKDIRKIGSFISSKQAQEMIAAYQQQEPEGTRSVVYGRHVFEALLQIPGCEGIRAFNAINAEGIHTFVLIGANAKGKHIYEAIFDTGLPCPASCPFGSADLEGYLWKKANEAPLDLTTIGASISRAAAHEMIATWQNEEPEAFRSWLYGRELFDALLAVPGCAGIRIFNGINDQGAHSLVFTAVDAVGGNILEYKVNTANGVETVKAPLADSGLPCPASCPDSIDLKIYMSKDRH
ncbi:hypothetical protein [uncultured Chitinophaga sp.]|jgi:hypothetical protein|uniref:hypothetical protein n=1 Tax=uncultured Chitinophaga sp. TaxID=339340 RepID=UPI0026035719|nr:hypothetical protein [uncultured Chitinophaga sp.]